MSVTAYHQMIRGLQILQLVLNLGGQLQTGGGAHRRAGAFRPQGGGRIEGRHRARDRPRRGGDHARDHIEILPDLRVSGLSGVDLQNIADYSGIVGRLVDAQAGAQLTFVDLGSPLELADTR